MAIFICSSGMPGRKVKWLDSHFKNTDTDTWKECNCHHPLPQRAKGFCSEAGSPQGHLWLSPGWLNFQAPIWDQDCPCPFLLSGILLPLPQLTTQGVGKKTQLFWILHCLCLWVFLTFTSIPCKTPRGGVKRKWGGAVIGTGWRTNIELHISRPKHKSTRNYRSPPTCT